MLAAAKINLDLRITGRRDDGYHLLDSIVVFTEYGDQLEAVISDQLSLEISGPFSEGLPCDKTNLILKAAKLVCNEAGVKPKLKFCLTKNLPVSSGIGGGSADAAAAMLLTRDLLSIDLSDEYLLNIALKLGADVPVCLRSHSTVMRGIGDELNRVNLVSDCYILLVNSGVSVSTPPIFKKYADVSEKFDKKRNVPAQEIHLPLMIDILKNSQNSLETVACELEPSIIEVLEAIGKTDKVLFSRMSGSGATCFGLYKTQEQCMRAASDLRAKTNEWWIQPTKVKI